MSTAELYQSANLDATNDVEQMLESQKITETNSKYVLVFPKK